jgi:HlyD family secretion protein
MKKWLKWLLIIIAVSIVVGFLLKKGGVIGKPKRTEVVVEKSIKRTIIQTVNGSGKIYPEVEVKISPDVSGELIELNVKEGDSVKKGQVLGRIYGELLDLQRQQASAQVNQAIAGVGNSSAGIEAIRARLALAQKNYETNKKLFEEKVISRLELDQFSTSMQTAQAEYNAALKGIQANQAQVQTARTSLEQANKNLNRTTVYATMDGIVSVLNNKKGERVVGTAQMAGTEILRIADMRTLETVIEVSENDIPKVKVGDTADIDIDAYVGRKFRGIVTQIGSSSSNVTSQNAGQVNDVTNYKVKIRIDPTSYTDLIQTGRSFPLRPGMTTNVKIKTQINANVLTVPLTSVTSRSPNDSTSNKPNGENTEDDIVVFVFNQTTKRVKQTKIKTGIQDLDYIEVLEGLKEGDEVVSLPYIVISKELNNDTEVATVTKEKLLGKKQKDEN